MSAGQRSRMATENGMLFLFCGKGTKKILKNPHICYKRRSRILPILQNRATTFETVCVVLGNKVVMIWL
ncbi:hypothetical protein NPIL_533041 [Nephila pilipes]|uniref:Uncharacterized protein n=1 Tax=Nephila pilipes TaxID=299642 RepID=A0A8X6TTB2_NEPPI|nr:hypothetical protein NPIL_533041 [Nephila pilipes]